MGKYFNRYSYPNRIRVLESVLENPHIRQPTIAREIGINQSSVYRMLRANNFYPFHMRLVHELRGTDFPRRLTFCNFVREQLLNDLNFIRNNLFSDGAKFQQCQCNQTILGTRKSAMDS